MTQFTSKKYQQDPANQGGVLDSVEACFKAFHTFGRASLAFTAVTEDLWGQSLRYTPLAGFAPDMPYFCLRVPTGGGKRGWRPKACNWSIRICCVCRTAWCCGWCPANRFGNKPCAASKTASTL